MGKKKIDEAIQVGKKIYQSKIKPQIKEDPATWMHDHLNYPEPAEQYARWRNVESMCDYGEEYKALTDEYERDFIAYLEHQFSYTLPMGLAMLSEDDQHRAYEHIAGCMCGCLISYFYRMKEEREQFIEKMNNFQRLTWKRPLGDFISIYENDIYPDDDGKCDYKLHIVKRLAAHGQTVPIDPYEILSHSRVWEEFTIKPIIVDTPDEALSQLCKQLMILAANPQNRGIQYWVNEANMLDAAENRVKHLADIFETVGQTDATDLGKLRPSELAAKLASIINDPAYQIKEEKDGVRIIFDIKGTGNSSANRDARWIDFHDNVSIQFGQNWRKQLLPTDFTTMARELRKFSADIQLTVDCGGKDARQIIGLYPKAKQAMMDIEQSLEHNWKQLVPLKEQTTIKKKNNDLEL